MNAAGHTPFNVHRSSIEMKVSGTGWLCVKKATGEWLPVFELTHQQTLEYIQVLGILARNC